MVIIAAGRANAWSNAAAPCQLAECEAFAHLKFVASGCIERLHLSEQKVQDVKKCWIIFLQRSRPCMVQVKDEGLQQTIHPVSRLPDNAKQIHNRRASIASCNER